VGHPLDAENIESQAMVPDFLFWNMRECMSTEAGKTEAGVWLFNGERSLFAGGVFTSRAAAEQWIAQYKLSGVLTWYPLDTGLYDWVISKDYWQPKQDYQREATFIQQFSSAYAEHYHYENGLHDSGEA
jgi:hypothetical protein